MKQKVTLNIACVFLCLLSPECYSREAMATATSGIKDSGVFICEASYYTRASCIKESGQAVMACGKELQDDQLRCASWDYPFGVVLMVTNLQNGKQVKVVVSDRGPAKRLYRLGRKIDLSKAAFRALTGDLRRGIIPVKIIKIKWIGGELHD